MKRRQMESFEEATQIIPSVAQELKSIINET
jgi:hypothetical protein